MPLTHDKHLPRILICDPIHAEAIAKLQEHLDVDVQTDLTREELVALLPRYDGLVARRHTVITADLLQHAFRLKIIGVAVPTLDSVDVTAARARDITVVNAPDANTLAVAELTLGLLLAMARRLPWAESSLRQGQWEPRRLTGTGLSGKTLGIVGFGRIGRQVALRAQAFGMKVLVNQPELTPELALEASVEQVDLYALLAAADFVTLHLPLVPETHNLIGAAQLARMMPSAYLINTAQGGLVDEAALLAALDAERLAGAALDVFADADGPTAALVGHPRVIATPGIGAFTEDAAREAAETVAEQVIDFFAITQIDPILPLRIVPAERVFPHELYDQKRVNRLAGRMEREGVLKNPPIVMETDAGYMVLDGATRSTAMQQLGLPHMLVQVFSADTEGLQLKTWYHIIRQMDKAALLRLLGGLSDVRLVESDAATVKEDLFEYGGLCYLQFVDGSVFMVKPLPEVNHLDALNRLTSAYIDVAHTDRTLNDDVVVLQHEYPDMSALVVFPVYTVERVIQVALSGRRLPAGITRFIVPGRILRVNLELEVLRAERPLREKNRWLHERLMAKQTQGEIRYYAEPIYLLDE